MYIQSKQCFLRQKLNYELSKSIKTLTNTSNKQEKATTPPNTSKTYRGNDTIEIQS